MPNGMMRPPMQGMQYGQPGGGGGGMGGGMGGGQPGFSLGGMPGMGGVGGMGVGGVGGVPQMLGTPQMGSMSPGMMHPGVGQGMNSQMAQVSIVLF